MTSALRQQIIGSQDPRTHDFLSKLPVCQEPVAEQAEILEDTKRNSEGNERYNRDFPTDLVQKFGEDIVIMFVETKASDRFYVRCIHGQIRTLETEPSAPPVLSFSHLMESKKQRPAEIAGIIRFFSKRNKQGIRIRKWMHHVSKTHKLSFIIVNDRTDFEFPWEMLDLDGMPLGAAIPVVRWQDIPDPAETGEYKLLPFISPDYDTCGGSVLAYANTGELAGADEEIKALRRHNATCIYEVEKFISHLRQLQTRIGMIFIASHGFFEDDIFSIAFGEEQDTNKRITLMRLYNYDFDFLRTSSCLVFMNACHSGRLRKGDPFNAGQEYRIGFAAFFLEQGAKGVIGTLGKVGEKFAAQFSKDFFSECQQHPDLTVPAILRNIRFHVTKRLKENETKENWYRYLYYSMYVYYGSPMTRLKLTTTGEQDRDVRPSD